MPRGKLILPRLYHGFITAYRGSCKLSQEGRKMEEMVRKNNELDDSDWDMEDCSFDITFSYEEWEEQFGKMLEDFRKEWEL